MSENSNAPQQHDPSPREPFDLRAVLPLALAVAACALAYRDPARWGSPSWVCTVLGATAESEEASDVRTPKRAGWVTCPR